MATNQVTIESPPKLIRHSKSSRGFSHQSNVPVNVQQVVSQTMMAKSHGLDQQPHQKYINKYQHPQQLTPDQIHLSYD